MVVDLVRVDGEWLVDDYTPVSAAEGAEGTPRSPTWYDVLGVAPDATPRRCAPHGAPASPTSTPPSAASRCSTRPPRCCSTPQQRAAYDAESVVPEPEPEPEPAASVELEPGAGPGGARRAVPGWVLAGLGVATLLVAGAALVVAVTVPSDRSVEEATTAARTAAERAIVPILSYDAADSTSSKAAAEGYLTGDYRKEYDQALRRRDRDQRAVDRHHRARPTGALRRGPRRRRSGAGVPARRPVADQQGRAAARGLPELGDGHDGAGRDDWLVSAMSTD